MTGRDDVELVLQRARERFPDARPQVLSDNGSQFVAREFKPFIALAGMTHERMSPQYPQAIFAARARKLSEASAHRRPGTSNNTERRDQAGFCS